MDQEVKRINNKEQLKQIIEKLFLNLPVHMKSDNEDIPVKVISYNDPLLEVEHSGSPSEVRNLQAVKGDSSLMLECNVESRNETVETLVPVNLHLTRQIRKMPRIDIPEKDKRVLWVTNLVTIKNFPDYFVSTNEKRDKLINAYKTELHKTFYKAEIVLRQTVRLDYRMRTLNTSKKSIFVPHMQQPEKIDPDRFVSFPEYSKLIRYDKIPESIIAEITVPLLYKNIFLYGFVRVISTEALELKDYETVERVSKELTRHLETYGAFPVNREKSPVTDINLSGVGCMHPHVPHIMKNFEPGENVIFDIHFPDDSIVPYTGILKNIKSGEKAHRLGIQFDMLENLQRESLETCIANLPVNQGTAPSVN
ncbi:MAG: PilZ domain-containing protein [Spirochaetia bacterium]|nr:PilZ domain-containing protein [Spirochaetia bacterium]